MKQFVFSLSLALMSHLSIAQTTDLKIDFPDIPGYKTLICEFHQHTVFSDGAVWPSIRVGEALRYGLDAISLTDHLEYQPKKDEIPHNDRNTAFKMAVNDAKGTGLIVVNGAEITRGMPPGHLNAIFIEDANKLLIDDAWESIEEANRQGGFVFWNHPHWVAKKKDGVAEFDHIHTDLVKEGLIQGIEIVNEHTYSDEAFQLALDNNLAIIGNTDIHGMVEWDERWAQNGRCATFVFAGDKTSDALKKGLLERRTAVWHNNTLFGSQEFLGPLVKASLNISDIHYKGNSSVLVFFVENTSDADYILDNQSNYLLHTHAKVFIVKAHSTTRLEVKTLQRVDKVDLKFKVLNTFVTPEEHAEIELHLEVE